MENKVLVTKPKSYSHWIRFAILILASIIFCIGGLVLSNITKQNSQYYEETTATIVDIVKHTEYEKDANGNLVEEVSYQVYVDYTVDNVTYERVKINDFTIGMKVGDEVTVAYDTRNPGKLVTSIKTMNILTIVILVVSGICLIVAIVSTRKSIIKKKAEEELKAKLLSSGQVVRSTIHYVIGTKVFYVKCVINDYIYISENFTPNTVIFPGCTVNIYFDKEQYASSNNLTNKVKDYYIDINSIELGQPIEVTPEDMEID